MGHLKKMSSLERVTLGVLCWRDFQETKASPEGWVGYSSLFPLSLGQERELGNYWPSRIGRRDPCEACMRRVCLPTLRQSLDVRNVVTSIRDSPGALSSTWWLLRHLPPTQVPSDNPSLPPAQEYEILLQMTYRDPGEKRELKKFLKHLKTPSPCLHGPSKIVRVKATTCKLASQGWGV